MFIQSFFIVLKVCSSLLVTPYRWAKTMERASVWCIIWIFFPLQCLFSRFAVSAELLCCSLCLGSLRSWAPGTSLAFYAILPSLQKIFFYRYFRYMYMATLNAIYQYGNQTYNNESDVAWAQDGMQELIWNCFSVKYVYFYNLFLYLVTVPHHHHGVHMFSHAGMKTAAAIATLCNLITLIISKLVETVFW